MAFTIRANSTVRLLQQGKMEAEEEMELQSFCIYGIATRQNGSPQKPRVLFLSLGSCFRANHRKQLLSMVERWAGGPWASPCPARGVREPCLPRLAPAV